MTKFKILFGGLVGHLFSAFGVNSRHCGLTSKKCVTVVTWTDWPVCFHNEINVSQPKCRYYAMVMRTSCQFSYSETWQRKWQLIHIRICIFFLIRDQSISAPPKNKDILEARATLTSNYTLLAAHFPTAYQIISLNKIIAWFLSQAVPLLFNM